MYSQAGLTEIPEKEEEEEAEAKKENISLVQLTSDGIIGTDGRTD